MSKSILDTAEVIHDYMRNGDRSTSREECITWIAQLIQEASQQAPSATVDANNCTQCGCPIEDDVTICGECANKQPSATVDEKIKAIAQRLAQHVTFDRKEAIVSGCIKVGYTNHNVAELIEEGITEYLRSQQPTVDVEKIARDCVGWLEGSALTTKLNLSDEADAIRIVSRFIQEALRGSYTREDMQKSFDGGVSSVDKFGETLETFDEWIKQYDTERGK